MHKDYISIYYKLGYTHIAYTDTGTTMVTDNGAVIQLGPDGSAYHDRYPEEITHTGDMYWVSGVVTRDVNLPSVIFTDGTLLYK